MKKMIVAVAMVVSSVAPALAERPRLDESEAPRATDLLRAQKLADQAKKRLEMPAHRGGGWKQGGTAWGEAESRDAREPRDVIINLGAPRPRPRAER